MGGGRNSKRGVSQIMRELAALALLYIVGHLLLGNTGPVSVDEYGTVPAILQGFFSELFWVTVGAVVGGGFLFAGAAANPRIGNVTHWMVLMAVPFGALLSGL